MSGIKPTKEYLFNSEQLVNRSEAAAFLRQLADKLKKEGSFTLVQNERQLQVTLSSTIKLEVSYRKKGDKYKLEVELEWREEEGMIGIF